MSNTPGRPRRLRQNLASILAGNSVYRLAQWLLIVVIARLGDAEMVGSFALAQAITAPVFLTVGLNLRAARTTDVERAWTASQYYKLRTVLNAVALSVSCVLAWTLTTSWTFLLVAIAIGLSKSAEATSQVAYGYFQYRERLDLVSRSLLLRSLAGPIPFAGVLFSTHDLALSCGALAVGWTSVMLLHDSPVEKRLQHSDIDQPTRRDERATLPQLVRVAAPLGLTAGIGSITTNVPRYAVQLFMGTTSLGLFATLAYLGQIIGMITGSLSDSILARLARAAHAENRRAFTRNILILCSFGIGVSLLVILAGVLLGAPLTRFLLGEEYVNQPVLITLLIGASFVTFQRTLERGLQGGRRFQQILTMDSLTAIATLVTALVVVPQYGLLGAAGTLGAGFFAGSTLGLYYIRRMIRSMSDEPRHSNLRRHSP